MEAGWYCMRRPAWGTGARTGARQFSLPRPSCRGRVSSGHPAASPHATSLTPCSPSRSPVRACAAALAASTALCASRLTCGARSLASSACASSSFSSASTSCAPLNANGVASQASLRSPSGLSSASSASSPFGAAAAIASSVASAASRYRQGEESSRSSAFSPESSALPASLSDSASPSASASVWRPEHSSAPAGASASPSESPLAREAGRGATDAASSSFSASGVSPRPSSSFGAASAAAGVVAAFSPRSPAAEELREQSASALPAWQRRVEKRKKKEEIKQALRRRVLADLLVQPDVALALANDPRPLEATTAHAAEGRERGGEGTLRESESDEARHAAQLAERRTEDVGGLQASVCHMGGDEAACLQAESARGPAAEATGAATRRGSWEDLERVEAEARTLQDREARLFKQLDGMIQDAPLERLLGRVTQELAKQQRETGGTNRNHGELSALWKLQIAEELLQLDGLGVHGSPRPSQASAGAALGADGAEASSAASTAGSPTPSESSRISLAAPDSSAPPSSTSFSAAASAAAPRVLSSREDPAALSASTSPSWSASAVCVAARPDEALASVFLSDLRLQRRLLAVVARRWRRLLDDWLGGLHDLRRGEGHPPEMTDFERYLTFVLLPHLRRVSSQALHVLERFRRRDADEPDARRRRKGEGDNESRAEAGGGASAASPAAAASPSVGDSSSSLSGPDSSAVALPGAPCRERRVWILAVSLLEELKDVVQLFRDLAQRRVLLHFAPVVMSAIHLEMQARRSLFASSPPDAEAVSAAASTSPMPPPLEPPLHLSAPRSAGVAAAVAEARAVFLASPAGRRPRKESAALSASPSQAVGGEETVCGIREAEANDRGAAGAAERDRLSTELLSSRDPWPAATRWAGHLHVEVLRGFGRMGLYSEKLLHVVSEESKALWPHDLVFFLFECGRYGLAVQHLIDKHAAEASACVDYISDPLLYLATAALHRSSISHRVFFDAALPRLSAAVETYHDPAFLRTLISLCRALDPHLELAPYRALVSEAAVAMRRFVPQLDVNASGLILGLIGNRTARTPQTFRSLARALCGRLETLQHAYAIRQRARECEEDALAGQACAGGSKATKETPNIFSTVASALTLGDIITSLASFNLRTHLYPLLEDVVCKTLEGILFARKEALWFLIWIGLASTPNFTPKKLTLALREKMLEDGDSEVQNGLTEINHTVQKLGAFHAQRLLLPLQLMRVYDAEIARVCIDTSLARDRASFKRLDSSLSLVFPLAYANALRSDHAAEALAVWDVNSAKVFLHGNAFRGEYGRATMLAMLWSAAVTNLHVQQVHVTGYLDKLFWCIDVPPPALDAWDAFRFSALPAPGYLASLHALFSPQSSQIRAGAKRGARPGAAAASTPPQETPCARDEEESEATLTSFSPSSFNDWHALDDIRQHDRLAIFQIREPLLLLHQVAATYIADAPHAVRRSSKFPLIRAWANAAVDPRVDEDRAISGIVQELQDLLATAGIRSRAFVPCSPDEDALSRPPSSSAEKARDTVTSWIGSSAGFSASSSSERDEIVTINVHEWSEAQSADARLSLLLEKCEAAGISIPFCVE
ncbi:hypothetical protein BESB_083340 [Besnoitia besnoiti]|uniref:Uncharacterized protein n=1 Tax=Besnoitia besnoiti TaxID=94643 RepID=A0A2A9M593_BESBE|nr:hypothetical protein BESB_083340 [Besnoitia besnoiti]PFH33135.1 hypothetical protein BESB_083340 [Besnoitia besnoiti]